MGGGKSISLGSVAILLVAIAATASYSFTWNAVGVALPHMKGAFSATNDQIAWVMIAFVIGSAASTASVGWFSARFGRRRVFLLSISGFALTQLGCGFSTTLEGEVFWRLMQGVTGAPLVPVTQLIAVSAFPEGRHGQATSWWALGFIAANVIAPTAAGWLVDNYGWPYVFFVNLPIAALCLALGYVLIPDSGREKKPMDWVGFLTLIGGVGCLQLVLARGERLDWFESTEIVVESVVAGILLYIFAAHTMLSKQPYLERGLLLNRSYMLGLLFIFVIGAVMYLPMLLLPIQLQQLRGFPPTEIGYLMMARGVGTIISLAALSRFRDTMNPIPFLIGGLLLNGYGAYLMTTWTADVRPIDVMTANFLHGISTGAIWSPLNLLALSRLPRAVQDQGFAFFYLMFDIGSAFGTALFVAMHTRHSQIGHALLSEHVSPYSDPLRAAEAAGSAFDPSTPGGLAMIDNEITRQALAIAYNNSYLVMALALWILIPAVLLFRKRRRQGPSRLAH